MLPLSEMLNAVDGRLGVLCRALLLERAQHRFCLQARLEFVHGVGKRHHHFVEQWSAQVSDRFISTWEPNRLDGRVLSYDRGGVVLTSLAPWEYSVSVNPYSIDQDAFADWQPKVLDFVIFLDVSA
eukprot:s2897_g7.t1